MIDIDFPRTLEELTVWKLEHAALDDTYFRFLCCERSQIFGNTHIHNQLIDWLHDLYCLRLLSGADIVPVKAFSQPVALDLVACIRVVGVRVMDINRRDHGRIFGAAHDRY
jgi:hypothetical protein